MITVTVYGSGTDEVVDTFGALSLYSAGKTLAERFGFRIYKPKAGGIGCRITGRVAELTRVMDSSEED